MNLRGFVPGIGRQSSGSAGVRRSQTYQTAQAPVSASALASYTAPSVAIQQGMPIGTGIARALQVPPALRLGPAFKGAAGSGRTNGAVPASGQAGTYAFAGYVSEEPTYQPQPYDYMPPYEPRFRPFLIPRSIGEGFASDTFAPTYRAHDFTPADRFFNQGRSAANWQQTAYPVPARMLTQRQQPAVYNLYNAIALARPLNNNEYVFAATMAPQVQSTLGGAAQRPLGY